MFAFTISAASSDIRVLHSKVKKANAGESIEVKAGVINAYKVNYIILHFKDVDEKNWSEKEMTPKDGRYAATIEADEIDKVGLVYYIEIIDISGKTIKAFASKENPQYVTIVGANSGPNLFQNNNKKAKKTENLDEDFAIYVDSMEDEVVTASKYSQSRAEAPANISVITGDEIKEFGYHSLLELLRDQGFEVNDNGSWPDIGLRGINDRTTYGKYLLVFLDGHNMSFTQFYRNIISNGLIPIEDIERIEIQKGPGSSIWGANALLGVINIITKNYESSSIIEVGGGNLGTGSTHIRASKIFNDKFSVFASFMSYTQDTSDDMVVKEWSEVAGKDVKLRNMAQDSYTFFGKVLLYDFKLTSYYNKYDPYAPITTFSVGGDDTRLVTERFYNTLSYEKELLTNKDTDISLNASLSMDNYKFGYGAQYEDNPYSTPNSDCTVDPEDNTKVICGKQFTRKMIAGDKRYDAKIYSVINLKKLKSTLIAGADAEYLDAIRWYYPEVFAISSIPEPHFTQLNTGLFSQLEVKPVKWAGIVGGLRYDKNSIYDVKISPKASLVLTPGDFFLKTIWGQGYKAPSLHELYYFRKGAYYGNPTLRPESSSSLEIQLGYIKKNFLDIEFTYFRTGIDDVISYQSKTNTSGTNEEFDSRDDFPSSQLPIDGDKYNQQANKKEYRTSGFELFAKVQPIKPLYFILRASHVTAESIGATENTRLNYGQEKFLSFAVNYRYLKKYNVNLSGRYVSDKLLPKKDFKEPGNPYNPTEDTTLSTDAYFLLNIAFNVEDLFIKGLNTSFRVENLLNQTYYDAGREILYPQTGVRFWGYLKYTF